MSTTPLSTSHTVHVVSMLQVASRRGSAEFQSKEVSGAQNSDCLLLLSSALRLTPSSPTAHTRR